MKLTVILRDDGPMINCGDSPTYRSVQVELTPEQERAIAPRCTYTVASTKYSEAISKCFIEPVEAHAVEVCPNCGQSLISNEHRCPDDQPEGEEWSGGFAPNH